ncbi:MAG: isopentenyl phosphate kinase [Candidatus Micrarchaeia archaeon]
MHKSLYFIKLGGSVITDTSKPNTARYNVIKRLLTEVFEAKSEMGFDVIIGHGGGSFPHIPAKKYHVQEGIKGPNDAIGAAITKLSAMELNSIIIKEGINLGIPVFSFPPSAFSIAKSKTISKGFVDSISKSISAGFIPVVYGDVAIDTDQGASIVSTEEVFRFLSTQMIPDAVIFGTDVNGVFTSDPKKDKNAIMIKQVDYTNIDSIVAVSGSADRADVTGGMKTKVSVLYNIVKSTGSRGYIIDITKEGHLKGLLTGKNEECTTVLP